MESIIGMGDKEALALIDDLMRHATQKKGSSWNRVGDFLGESARKAGIAEGFCISRDGIFGMKSGWHEHRNASGGYGIRIRSQAFALSRRCAEFSVIRRRA
jgi:hypothetical protein